MFPSDPSSITLLILYIKLQGRVIDLLSEHAAFPYEKDINQSL